MVKRTDLKEKYLSFLINLVCNDQNQGYEYTKLFEKLMKKEFYAVIDLDENRIADAIDLRSDFERSNGYKYPIIDDPVSVLEVMVALANRCEETIMGNFEKGDRTSIWFWYMIKSMGLLDYSDDCFDEYMVDDILENMLNRNYSKDGFGGLFYIPDTDYDLRKAEIWYQMSWWLDTIED